MSVCQERHGVVLWKVLLELFQKLVGAAAIGGRASQGAKFPYPSQAPQRGECRAVARQRGTAQVGGSPFYTKPFQIAYPLFSLAVEAQRKKLSKKEHAAGDVSPRARGDQRSARWMGGRFLKKATEKLSTGFAAKSPLNINLKCKTVSKFIRSDTS